VAATEAQDNSDTLANPVSPLVDPSVSIVRKRRRGDGGWGVGGRRERYTHRQKLAIRS